MRDELTNTLRDHFPDLMDNCYEIWVGDGWYSLIQCLLQNLNATTDKPAIAEFSSKFGRLRVITDRIHYSEMAAGAILMAEVMSGHVCDVCGGKADTTITGHHSRCREHQFVDLDE